MQWEAILPTKVEGASDGVLPPTKDEAETRTDPDKAAFCQIFKAPHLVPRKLKIPRVSSLSLFVLWEKILGASKAASLVVTIFNWGLDSFAEFRMEKNLEALCLSSAWIWIDMIPEGESNNA